MEEKNYSTGTIMARLLQSARPWTGTIVMSVILGVLGQLCAIAVPVIGVKGILQVFVTRVNPFLGDVALPIKLVMAAAVCSGLFLYGQQFCSHYVAYKAQAQLRGEIFDKLRELSPNRLKELEKGNMLVLYTTDIELLESFFARTVTTGMVAIMVSVIMAVFIGLQFWLSGVIVLIGFLIVGVAIPIGNTSDSTNSGLEYRNDFGDMCSYILSQIRGLQETIQYHGGEAVDNELKDWAEDLEVSKEELSGYEKSQRNITQLVVRGCVLAVMISLVFAYIRGIVDLERLLTAVVATLSSFGPVITTANLSSDLSQTLASGNRIISLLEEEQDAETKPVKLRDEIWLSHHTIAENIAYGKPEATIEEIHRAAKKANLNTFISSLPDGYDTELGDMASILSDGQKQRICIARAFLSPSPVMTLDQSTSTLDPLNEGLIFKSLKEEGNKRPVELITHGGQKIKINNKQ